MRRLAGALVVTAVLVGSAAVAGAFTSLPPLKAKFDKRELPKHGHVTARATCPKGSEVVSGGFATPDVVYAGGGPYTDIQAAYRHSASTFFVKAENEAFRTGHVYSYVYCGDVGKVTVAKSKAVELGSFEDGTATAHCPDGLVALSGGWQGIATHGGRAAMVPFRSIRVGSDGWRVSVKNQIFKGSQNLVAYAYCVDTEKAPQPAVNTVKMDGFNLSAAGASCPRGSQAISGGFDAATRGGHSIGASMAASRRKKEGQRWKVTYINGNDPRKIEVVAYCVPLA